MTTRAILLARRFRIDATVDLTLAGGWAEVAAITAFDPGLTPNNVDSSAYDTNGISSYETTMYDGQPTFTFETATQSGVDDPGQAIVFGTWVQFAPLNRIGIRWYDRQGRAGKYNMSAIVIPVLKRSTSGVKDLETWTATCQITDGTLNTGISNPIGSLAPVITAVLPSGEGVGGEISIQGDYFTGTTGASHVTIGGVNATSYEVVDDNEIIAVVPAGSAGSAPVIVTNATGASAPFPYTRT